MTTSSPASARRPAHTSPAGPAPMTTTSQLRSLMASSQSRCDSRYKAVASSADVSPCPRARPRRRGAARGLRIGLERADGRHGHQRDGEHQRRHGRLDPGAGPRGGGPRSAPGQGRRLPGPGLPHLAARRQAAALHRRAGGRDRRRPRRQAPGPAVPRHPLEGHGRRRAGPALDGLRARLRAVGAVLRLLHREERHGGDLGVPPRRRRPRRPQQRPARAAHGRPRAQPQRRPDDLRLRQADVRRHRRWRRRQRPARHRAATRSRSARCWARSCASTRSSRAARRTRSLPRTRSPGARAPAARSTPTGCATRGASPSTAPPTTSSIGDVGQDEVEEIDFVKKGGGRGANFGWRPWEGRRRNFNEPAPHAIFPVITHTHQAGFCSITGGFIARDRGVPGLYGRYVYGDYCESRLRAATLRAGRRAQSRTLAVPPDLQASRRSARTPRGAST